MKIDIIAVAEQEFFEAVEYYNDQRSGLGYEFAAEITRTVKRIADFPKAWAEISGRARRCLTNKFPFGVIYQLYDNTILIIAIMNTKRDPIHWQNRLDQ